MIIVYLERRSPSRAFGNRCMEHREVDQSISCKEEIREQWSNRVQLSCKTLELKYVFTNRSTHITHN